MGNQRVLTVEDIAAMSDDEYRVFKAKQVLWKALNALQPSFKKDEHNEEALIAAAHWLAKIPYAGAKVGQGMLLSGPIGTGKTVLMSAIERVFAMRGGPAFPVVNAIRIVKEYNRSDGGSKDPSKMGGDHVILMYANMPRLTIDDAVREEDGRHYGKVANVIDEIIALRYEKWRRGECLTNMTTNGGAEELVKRYDKRSASRMVEMMFENRLTGPDRRMIAAPPVLIPVFPDLFELVEVPPEPTEEEIAKTKAVVDEGIRRVHDAVAQAANEIPPNQKPVPPAELVAAEAVVRAESQARAEVDDRADAAVAAASAEPSSLALDLIRFSERIMKLDMDGLLKLRAELIAKNQHQMDVAKPYLQELDAEIEALKAESTTEAAPVAATPNEMPDPSTI